MLIGRHQLAVELRGLFSGVLLLFRLGLQSLSLISSLCGLASGLSAGSASLRTTGLTTGLTTGPTFTTVTSLPEVDIGSSEYPLSSEMVSCSLTRMRARLEERQLSPWPESDWSESD